MTLEPIALPKNPADWPAFAVEQGRTGLATARSAVERLKDGTPRTAEESLKIWNTGEAAAGGAAEFSELFSEVHPDPAVREIAEETTQDVTAFLTARGQDRALYEVFAALDPAELEADEARLLDRILRDFRRSGIDRDEATRTRLAEIDARLTETSQAFNRNIRDGVRSIRIRPEQLDGLPEDYRAAHPAEDDGLVTITTDYPDLIPFRTFAHDRDARIAISREANLRAWPANDSLLHELLDLRDEKARLLGSVSWPDFDAEVKMVGTGAAIDDFIEQIGAAAREPAARDVATLLARAQQDHPSLTELAAGDSSYYSEIVGREQYAVDAQEIRQYFDFTQVRSGVLDVTGRLFGIDYRERADAPVWADDVTAYDVHRDGERIGRIYLDLHPREGKFTHAAQFTLATGVAGERLPEGVLVCNFPRGLMEHRQVQTLFHEFGHLVHHILGGGQKWARFSGVATEWDFVEAPSQMLEEWVWDAEILRSFARNAAGAPIPAELVEKMRLAEGFGRGLHVSTQVYYAAVSYYLHRDRPADHDAALRELSDRYSPLPAQEGTHFQTSFGHLDGYGSGYYTYMWSLVIAKDLFGAFDGSNLFDPVIAGRYRDEILARGGSADAANLVESFLARPYSLTPFLTWLTGS